MADETVTILPSPAPTPDTGFHKGTVDPEAVKQANEATLRQSDAQGRHTGMSSEEQDDAASALDALLKQVTETPPAPDPAPAPAPSPDPAPAPAPEPPPAPPPAPPGTDLFAGVELPPKASPKSAEAFATVKERAAAEISRMAAELAEEKSRRAELEQKSGTLPEDVTKELEELRQFRAALDVKADPAWKEYDAKYQHVERFIEAQLRRSPLVKDEHIAEIKKIGGFDKINLDAFLKSLNDPTIEGIVRSKYADMQMIRHDQDEARKVAEGRAQEYLKERQEALEVERGSTGKAALNELAALQPRVSWLQPKPTTEAGAVEHNKLVSQVQEEIKQALQDDSPKMRAILALGMGRFTVTSALLTAREKELADAKATVDSLTKQLEGIKQSSGRLRSGGAPVDGGLPVPKPASPVNTDTAGALDSLRDQVLAERRRANLS